MFTQNNSNFFNRLWDNIEVAGRFKEMAWAKHAKHVAELALPFVAIYKPDFTKGLSYGLRSWNITQHAINLTCPKKHDSADLSKVSAIQGRLKHVYGIIKGLSELGSSYCARKEWVAVNAILDFLENIYDLSKSSSQDRMDKLGQCAMTALQLVNLLKKNSPRIMMLSLLTQAATCIYQMCIAARDVYREGTPVNVKTLDVIAKGLLGFIRMRQVAELIKQIQVAEFIDQIKGRAIVSEPLTNLSRRIDEKQSELVDPTTGKKHKLGAWFHGYGKGIVKWGNIRFNKKTLEDGTIETGLVCQVTNLHWERITQIAGSLNTLTSEESKGLAPILGCEDIKIYPNRAAIKGVAFGDIASEVDCGFYCFGDMGFISIGCCNEDTPNNIIFNKYIGFYIKGDKDIGDFQRLLSIIGLGDILEPFTVDDVERMNLGFLFKTLCPQESDALQRDQAYFDLPPKELKAKMQTLVPAMKKYAEQYPVGSSEVLPGYVHPSIQIAAAVHDCGLRALTAVLFRDWDASMVTSIIQHGLFSQKIQYESGLRNELDVIHLRNGAINTVFTQVILQKDVQDHRPLHSFGYTGAIRFYFSLDALNRGSY